MPTTSVPIGAGTDSEQPGELAAQLIGSAPLDPVSGRRRPLPCRQDPDLWFAESPGELERAKSLCEQCPVKSACLAGALSRGEPWGVWGGEIFERGSIIARKRPRGRPRKHPVGETGRGGSTRRNREAAA